ncbi:MAG: hypothetical protein WBB76_04355 [Gaiellaceae bacterium]
MAFVTLLAAGNALAGIPQEGTTDQAATPDGAAAQTQPVNVVVTVRVDSPGNDGVTSQSNVAVGEVAAGNDSSTTQAGGDGQTGTGQQAATAQDASASGNAAQTQPVNIVVSVRIDSPGNNGPVSQTNVTAVGVSADNAAVTAQSAQNGSSDENTPMTAVPLSRGLRPGAALAEAADAQTAADGRSSPPRPSARTPQRGEGDAPRTLGRPSSGAAAAGSAGFPAAAARAPSATRVATRPLRSARSSDWFGADALGRLGSILPASPAADQPAGGPGTLSLTAIALLGALLLWVISSWLGGARPAWRRWR